MAEGDTIHRNARRLQELLESSALVSAEAPNPRSPLLLQRERLGALVGRRLVSADPHGKHLVLRFEDDLALHVHQGMTGSWRIARAGQPFGKPRLSAWVVLGVEAGEAAEFGGPTLALRTEAELRSDRTLRSLGPDLIASGFETATGVAALRRAPDLTLGEALLDQRLIAGIGNIFKSEACWTARADPWLRTRELADERLAAVVEAAITTMREAVVTGRAPHNVYRRTGMPCGRCGAAIRSRGQGDGNRTTYWCPGCQS